jgi:hypothetical protein
VFRVSSLGARDLCEHGGDHVRLAVDEDEGMNDLLAFLLFVVHAELCS